MNQDPDERLILSSMMARLSSQIREKAFLIPKDWWEAWALYSSGLGPATPPGPINNFSLLDQHTNSGRTPVQKKQVIMTVDNCLTCFTDWDYYSLQLNLVPSVDYKIVSQEIWKYLLSHYGGGPEIPIYMMDEKMNGPIFLTDDARQFYPDDAPIPIRLIYRGNQSFLSHKHVFSALMTLSLLIEESKRVVSQFLKNCPPTQLRVIIQDQDGNFIAEEDMNKIMCLADLNIGQNSDIYVLRFEDGIKEDDIVRKSSLIQITFENSVEETKQEYYEEGFFGSKTSFKVSEQFKQNFKSILSKTRLLQESPKFKDHQNSRYKKQKHIYDNQDTQNEFSLHNQAFYQDEDQETQLMRALEASLKDSGLTQPAEQPQKQFEMKLIKTTESNDCVIEMGEDDPVQNLLEVYQQIRVEQFKKEKERAAESIQKDKLKFKRRSMVEVSKRLSNLARKLQNKY